jgi:hypothetical protein
MKTTTKISVALALCVPLWGAAQSCDDIKYCRRISLDKLKKRCENSIH